MFFQLLNMQLRFPMFSDTKYSAFDFPRSSHHGELDGQDNMLKQNSAKCKLHFCDLYSSSTEAFETSVM